MNIIRTPAIELSTIPAIVYKLKLASGGSGLKVLRLDQDASAVFTVDKRTGQLLPFGKVDDQLFPDYAMCEALELTNGLPFSARGKIKVSVMQTKEKEDVTEEDTADIDMVDSKEYSAIIERYCDENAKLNYQLMNKDFIQFAARSKMVSELIAAQASEESILLHIIRNRASYLSNSQDSLSDDEIRKLIETLDEINPRSAFKELRNHIRRMLANK